MVMMTACSWLPVKSEKEASPHRPRVTLVVISDIYRLDNLPFLRTLRSDLEKNEGDVLVVHGGDFLFPSLLSQRFNGEQMIDVYNLLDGDARRFDSKMFITFGNHEFEKDKLKHAPMLQSRIQESQFSWLGTNVEFKTNDAGQKYIQAENLRSSQLITLNGVRVGLVSATTNVKKAEYVNRFIPPVESVGNVTRELRKQGAQIVVALTHQTVAEDKAMLQALGSDAPDFIAGGHEHDRQHHVVNGRHIAKADADAASAVVVRLTPHDPQPETTLEFIDLPGKFAPDPAIQQRISAWDTRFSMEFCTEKKKSASCMQDVLGKTRVDLIAEELTIRRFETNLGNWLADTALSAFAEQGAQVAFLNSGGMRLNYNIPGGNVTRKHIDTLFAFPAQLAMIKLTGKQFQAVVDHAITDWTGNGRWLQISGFAFRHDPVNGKAESLSLITPEGLRRVRPDEMIFAVTNDYLLNKAGDQDGYRMLGDALIVDPGQPRIDLKEKVVEALGNAGSHGIAPRVDGRICVVGGAAIGRPGCKWQANPLPLPDDKSSPQPEHRRPDAPE